uniref:Uncharacterized protein n=1 Tax=Megaviridae environmental sample TaxID=1737588 RepID=A0A5J6VIU6_9VIRU|nr:MAG: hypothetical protein [Megaviridae environmental sample]
MKITIDTEIYPKVHKQSPEEALNTINIMLKIGYDILYKQEAANMDATMKKHKDSIIASHQMSAQNIIASHHMSSQNIISQMGEFKQIGNQLQQLIGLSSHSQKKGEIGEAHIDNYLQGVDGYTYTSTTQHHCGDGMLEPTDDAHQPIMVEVKNYTRVVNKSEIEKLKKDMVDQNVQFGLMISVQSKIVGQKHFDVEVFTHGKQYMIVYVAILGNYDLVNNAVGFIQLQQELVCTQTIDVKEIEKRLEGVNHLLDITDDLTQNFQSMETTVKHQLDGFYMRLRDYRYKIRETFVSIQQDFIQDATSIDNTDPYEYFKDFKSARCWNTFERFLEIFRQKNITFNNDNLMYGGTNIGKMKLTKTKATVSLDDLIMTKPNEQVIKTFLDEIV